MPLKIGITGGLGSGKTVVSTLLGMMNIPVYDSDSEAKKLINSDEYIRKELCRLLGNELYKNGGLDKLLLSSYLFARPENTAKVNGIIHPRVKQHFIEWASTYNEKEFIALESAILIESGFADCVDKIVWVTAPLELRIERALLRDKSSRELVLKRIKAQMEDERGRKCADFILENDDNVSLISQTICLIEELKKK